MSEKELFIRLTVVSFVNCCYLMYFPFGFEVGGAKRRGRLEYHNLIILAPDHATTSTICPPKKGEKE